MTPTISTSYGRRFAGPLHSIRPIPSTGLAELADHLDRLADDRLRDGDPVAADRLTWRAEAVRGVAMAPSFASEGAI